MVKNALAQLQSCDIKSTLLLPSEKESDHKIKTNDCLKHPKYSVLVQRKLKLLLFNFFISLLFHAGSKLLPIKITNPKPAIHRGGEINSRYVHVM